MAALGANLPPLPGTAEECRRIAELFDPAAVTLLEGARATEMNVVGHVAGRRMIHLATHGFVDQKHGNLFGAIALSPPAAPIGSSPDDGFLELNEIYGLPLSACDLAVLSACQTNVGTDRPLEAGATIARAFVAAGARRVVASHWSVADRSTAELMRAFIEAVVGQAQSGRPDYAQALHQARLRVRRSENWSAPFHWAPFVLIGSAR